MLLAGLQVLLDLGALAARLTGSGGVPDALRYAAAGAAALLAAVGVANALRVPPVKDVDVAIRDLPPAFEGYRLLQLTDLHVSRLFPAPWVRAMVERANASEADVIVVTGDFIDGSVAMRRADVEPLRGLRAPDGVVAVPGNHEYFFDYDSWMRHLAGWGSASSRTRMPSSRAAKPGSCSPASRTCPRPRTDRPLRISRRPWPARPRMPP